MHSTNRSKFRSWAMSVCSVLTLGVVFLGCKQKETAAGSTGNATAQQQQQQSAEPGYFKTHFQTEAQFVVETIAADIAEMVLFAQNHRLPDTNVFSVDAQESGGSADAPVYKVTINLPDSTPVQTTLTVSGPIWSEKVYAELTAAIAKKAGLKSPSVSGKNDTTMLTFLTDGLAETIEKENLELSENLEKDFSNATLHEQAAALLGAFALRENSGHFYDIRLPLCRMTAHLALARFLAGKNPPGINGQVADCMLLTLMNNEVAALEQLKKMDTQERAAATWVRVLQAYASHDFRPLTFSDFAQAQGIERVAWFAAYSMCNNRGVAWQKAGQEVVRIPDYSRIVAARGYGVELGNVMLQAWLPLEQQEIATIYQLAHGSKLKEADFVAALNEAPDRCFKPESRDTPQVCVIGWGLWALQLQHHFCHAVHTDYYHLGFNLGLAEEAQKFAEQSESQFGGLRFYAFVRRLDCTDAASYHTSTDQGWAFFTEFPHLTPIAWPSYLSGSPSFAAPYRPLPNPHCNEWTVHNPLPGTAYDAHDRFGFPTFIGGYGAGSEEQVRNAHKLAPYDLEICGYITRHYYKNGWTNEAAMSIYGPLLPYSAVAGMSVAASQIYQPAQYIKTMEQAAELDPSLYYNLGDYELQHGDTNRAFEVYEKGVKEDPDSLHAAKYSTLLIDHYLATGDKQKARETADLAGEVYSHRGLAAKAGYFEKTGDLAQAFEWFDKIAERYGITNDVLSFCSRHAAPTGDAALDKQIATRLKNWFDAQPKVSEADFNGVPREGIVVLAPVNGGVPKTTLRTDDIVVAVRGIRIHNTEQAAIARDLDPAPEITVILWRNGGYREVKVPLSASHRFGFNIQNYPSK